MTEERGPETVPDSKPKRQKMVSVFNTSKRQSFFLKGGKIPPQCSGKIPLAMYESPRRPAWLKRAERGDVV